MLKKFIFSFLFCIISCFAAPTTIYVNNQTGNEVTLGTCLVERGATKQYCPLAQLQANEQGIAAVAYGTVTSQIEIPAWNSGQTVLHILVNEINGVPTLSLVEQAQKAPRTLSFCERMEVPIAFSAILFISWLMYYTLDRV